MGTEAKAGLQKVGRSGRACGSPWPHPREVHMSIALTILHPSALAKGPPSLAVSSRAQRHPRYRGRGLLEIVHGCAPSASLLFAIGLPTSLAFIDAVNALR